jgi:hypothetical protein
VVWWILSGWVTEPDLDRGDVDGPLEDVLALVGARCDRAEGLELVEGAFGGVALLAGRGAGLRWSPAGGTLRSAGLLLVALLRDRCLDPPSAQVGPDRAVLVGLVGQQPPRAGPRPPTSEPADPQAIHQRFERNRVVALPGGSDPGQWPAPGVAQQVNLHGQPAAEAPQRLSVSPLGPRGRGTLVIRPSPLCRLWTRPGTRLRSRLGLPAAGSACAPGCPWAAARR